MNVTLSILFSMKSSKTWIAYMFFPPYCSSPPCTGTSINTSRQETGKLLSRLTAWLEIKHIYLCKPSVALHRIKYSVSDIKLVSLSRVRGAGRGGQRWWLIDESFERFYQRWAESRTLHHPLFLIWIWNSSRGAARWSQGVIWLRWDKYCTPICPTLFSLHITMLSQQKLCICDYLCRRIINL